MPFHVPFNQRASQRVKQEPVYIGFDSPAAPPRTPFNWWGFNGMWMSFASLMTLGFLSVIPFLISVIGLRRPGKGMATVGTLVSLSGMLLAGSIVTGKVSHEHRIHLRKEQAAVRRQDAQDAKQTAQILKQAREELIEYRGANDGQLPDDIEGNILVISFKDAWGSRLRFEPGNNVGVIRSSGPDRQFLTSDDLTASVKGRSVEVERHVPVSVKSNPDTDG